jgi:hypothetical protein
MKGWIYIMSNSSFSDGRIKIGMSSKDPIERKSELESSGVPEPFVIEYKALVDDYQKVEKRVHSRLEKYRPNIKREFFNCTILEAILAIRSIADISFEDCSFVSVKEVEIKASRQELISFLFSSAIQHYSEFHYPTETINKLSSASKGVITSLDRDIHCLEIERHLRKSFRTLTTYEYKARIEENKENIRKIIQSAPNKVNELLAEIDTNIHKNTPYRHDSVGYVDWYFKLDPNKYLDYP